MAGDWIKIRTDILTHPRLCQLSRNIGIGHDKTFILLYQTACWFREQGNYGVMKCNEEILDAYLEVPGFAAALLGIGWMEKHNGLLRLKYFTNVSDIRKSLGRRVRKRILKGKKCAACGSSSPLVVDHIIPICRGGTSEDNNLQALCIGCNQKKGKKTMEEWLHDC